MSDIDLDRLGDIWRQEPDPEELAELKRSAERVRRRARWAQLVNVGGAVVLSVILISLVYRNPGLDTAVIGGAAILYMLYGQVRQRRARAMEFRCLTGTAEEMLDQSIERVQAKLNYVRFGGLALGPGILMGLLVGYALDRRSGGTWSTPLDVPEVRVLVYVLSAALFVAVVAHLIRSYRSGRRELERLAALREAYRRAEEQDPT